MKTLREKSPAAVSSSSEFPCAIKPLILWMRSLGIELEAVDPSSLPTKDNESSGINLLLLPAFINNMKDDKFHYFRRIIVPTVGILLLAFNVSNIFLLLYTIVSRSIETSDLNILSSNIVIDYGIGGILLIGVHASLILVTRQSKWSRLWSNLNQIHNEIPSIHRPLRRVVLVGLVYIIVVLYCATINTV